MKKIKNALLIIFIIIIGVLSHYSYDLKQKNEDYGYTIKSWIDKSDSLKIKVDSLRTNYDSLSIQFDAIQQIYKKQLELIQNDYKDYISQFGHLSIDEHIILLSKHLSEEDNF